LNLNLSICNTMAEVFGIVAGAAGLAGLFTPCVDCFEYIQFGRHFGKDYERCLVKLDIIRLRLTRWGQAVGVYDDQTQAGVATQHRIVATDEELQQCASILQQIQDLFEEAESTSISFRTKSEKAKRTEEIALYQPDSDLDARYRSVHLTSRVIAKKRQKGTNFLQKVSWALYNKKKFDRLVEDLTGFIDALETVFPAEVAQLQAVICKGEVEEFEEVEKLTVLGDAAGKDDKLLVTEVTKAAARKGNHYENFEIYGEDAGFKTQVGNIYEAGRSREGDGNVYKGFKIGGKGFSQIGDRFER